MSMSSSISLQASGSSNQDQEVKLQGFLSKYKDFGSLDLIDAMVNKEFVDKIALSSSFGAEAAVLLDLISKVAPDLPVLFMDTGHLFEETLQYKETIEEHLGLTNIQTITPDPIHLENVDRDATLYERDPDYCCHIRKVLPFEQALKPYDAWFSGRKRFQNSERSVLEPIELDTDGRFKINPLYNWDYKSVTSAFSELKLPSHPLVAKGFPSIGCAPCTRAVKEGEDQRAGRWAGQAKTECGIHKSPAFQSIAP